jgi:chromosome segregation ATPase
VPANGHDKELFFRKWGEISGLGVYPSLCELVEGIVTVPLKAQLAETRQERERDRADHAAELERIEKRLIEERDATRDEAQEARAEADHAKADQVRMARDVATMFDELKALSNRYGELHADRARLQADVDRLTTELEQARRPWWRRLVGR